MLVSQDLHVSIDFDILREETVNHAFQRFDPIVTFLLLGQQIVDFDFHSVEVMHELCQATFLLLLRWLDW